MSAEEQQAAAPLRVGIDLGTSRSAISCSSGGQFVVDSFVGWPADLVARKVLKKDMVIGRDALDNRSMLDLHRPLERGLIKEGSDRDLRDSRPIAHVTSGSRLVPLPRKQPTAKGAATPRMIVNAMLGYAQESLPSPRWFPASFGMTRHL